MRAEAGPNAAAEAAATVAPAAGPGDGNLRVAAACVLVGLGLEVPSLVETTPATFLVFVLAGLPLLVAGAAIFLVTLWRTLVREGVL